MLILMFGFPKVMLADFGDFIPFVIISAVLLIALSLLLLQLYWAKKRGEELQAAASQLGLRYDANMPQEYAEKLAKFKLFNIGRSRTSCNVIVASTTELTLILFDYKYVTGHGKQRRTRNQTVAWVAGTQLQQLPEFNICPETWFDRLADYFINQDISFEEDPAFSKAFVLSGNNEAQIRSFFDAERRSAMLSIRLPTVECFPGELVFYRPRQLIEPENIKAIMTEAFELYKIFASKVE